MLSIAGVSQYPFLPSPLGTESYSSTGYLVSHVIGHVSQCFLRLDEAMCNKRDYHRKFYEVLPSRIFFEMMHSLLFSSTPPPDVCWSAGGPETRSRDTEVES